RRIEQPEGVAVRQFALSYPPRAVVAIGLVAAVDDQRAPEMVGDDTSAEHVGHAIEIDRRLVAAGVGFVREFTNGSILRSDDRPKARRHIQYATFAVSSRPRISVATVFACGPVFPSGPTHDGHPESHGHVAISSCVRSSSRPCISNSGRRKATAAGEL